MHRLTCRVNNRWLRVFTWTGSFVVYKDVNHEPWLEVAVALVFMLDRAAGAGFSRGTSPAGATGFHRVSLSPSPAAARQDHGPAVVLLMTILAPILLPLPKLPPSRLGIIKSCRSTLFRQANRPPPPPSAHQACPAIALAEADGKWLRYIRSVVYAACICFSDLRAVINI